MFIKHLSAAVVAVGLLQASGCASIVSGSTQTVSVMPLKDGVIAGGQCTLTNKKGSWIAPAGGTVTVKKASDALHASCEDAAAGLRGVAAAEKSTQAGWAVANFFLWDFCTLSCLIDFGSGSIYEYPSQIQVVMYPSSSPAALQPQVIAAPKPARSQHADEE